MRPSIADYEVIEEWGGAGRLVCRPPARLHRAGTVLVGEAAVDANVWSQLSDTLLRLADAGPRLLEVLEAGPDRSTGGVYVATEAAESPSPPDPGDPAIAVAAVGAAARAVHRLHRVGLAHGSVSPSALLRTSRGPVLDLPRLLPEPGRVLQMRSWQDLATVDPDLLRGEVPTRASDIWSLGATLHATLSERPLYPGIEEDEPVTAVQRVLFTRPEPDPRLAPEIRDLVRDCLAADPADRPATALAVARRLTTAAVAR